MLYRTLYLPTNPKAEYQRRNGVWYKRAIGTNDVFFPVAEQSQSFMESYFSKRYGFLYQYSTNAKIGLGVVVLLGVYSYIKFRKKSGISKLQ
jgi:hypothetical protein